MDPFLQSVARAFSGNREALPLVEAVILALLALAVLLQAATVLRAVLARRTRYERLLAERGLSPEDVRFGASLAARAHLPPLQLATHLDAFERATGLALRAPDGPEAALRIRRLRHALGYDRLPAHAPLLSTRELPPGTALEVGGQHGTLAAVDELALVVELRAPPGLAPGDPAALTLAHAREARYALRCRVLAVAPDEGGWRLRLEHDEQPARQQQRAYVRVPVDGPIRLRPVSHWPGRAPTGAELPGRLVDLSGGGAQVACREEPPPGAVVHASFELEGERFVELAAVVLGSEAGPDGPDGPRHVHLEFTRGLEAERERLVHALTRAELREQAARHHTA